MRRTVNLFTAIALALTGVVGFSAQHAAATSACTTSTWLSRPGDRIEVPSLSTGDTNCHLQVGNNSNAVTVLQNAVNRCYAYYHNVDLGHGAGVYIGVDGDFGSETKTALAKVQSWINGHQGGHLTVDGVYGPNTRSAMEFEGFDLTSGCIHF